MAACASDLSGLYFMLCAVLITAHLHACVLPHTTPGHTARSLLLLVAQIMFMPAAPGNQLTSITRLADCLSREHVTNCIDIASLVSWALRACLLHSGTQCCWPSHPKAAQFIYSADAVGQRLLDLSIDERQLTGKQTTWGHSLAGTSAQRCSNAHAMPALLCFQQPSSTFRPLIDFGWERLAYSLGIYR